MVRFTTHAQKTKQTLTIATCNVTKQTPTTLYPWIQTNSLHTESNATHTLAEENSMIDRIEHILHMRYSTPPQQGAEMGEDARGGRETVGEVGGFSGGTVAVPSREFLRKCVRVWQYRCDDAGPTRIYYLRSVCVCVAIWLSVCQTVCLSTDLWVCFFVLLWYIYTIYIFTCYTHII